MTYEFGIYVKMIAEYQRMKNDYLLNNSLVLNSCAAQHRAFPTYHILIAQMLCAVFRYFDCAFILSTSFFLLSIRLSKAQLLRTIYSACVREFMRS